MPVGFFFLWFVSRLPYRCDWREKSESGKGERCSCTELQLIPEQLINACVCMLSGFASYDTTSSASTAKLQFKPSHKGPMMGQRDYQELLVDCQCFSGSNSLVGTLWDVLEQQHCQSATLAWPYLYIWGADHELWLLTLSRHSWSPGLVLWCWSEADCISLFSTCIRGDLMMNRHPNMSLFVPSARESFQLSCNKMDVIFKLEVVQPPPACSRLDLCAFLFGTLVLVLACFDMLLPFCLLCEVNETEQH